jgi:hypothetical protein
MEPIYLQMIMRYLGMRDILSFVKCAKWIKGLLDVSFLWEFMYLEDIIKIVRICFYYELILKYTKRIYAKKKCCDDNTLRNIYHLMPKECSYHFEKYRINQIEMLNTIYYYERISVGKIIYQFDKNQQAFGVIRDIKWHTKKIYIKCKGGIKKIASDFIEYLNKNGRNICLIVKEPWNKFENIMKAITILNKNKCIDKLIIETVTSINWTYNVRKIYARSMIMMGVQVPKEDIKTREIYLKENVTLMVHAMLVDCGFNKAKLGAMDYPHKYIKLK